MFLHKPISEGTEKNFTIFFKFFYFFLGAPLTGRAIRGSVRKALSIPSERHIRAATTIPCAKTSDLEQIDFGTNLFDVVSDLV